MDSNKNNCNIKTMCTFLDITRSSYYKAFEKSAREIENEEFKAVITKIFKANKWMYLDPRIHHILSAQGFDISLKRVQRKIA